MPTLPTSISESASQLRYCRKKNVKIKKKISVLTAFGKEFQRYAKWKQIFWSTSPATCSMFMGDWSALKYIFFRLISSKGCHTKTKEPGSSRQSKADIQRMHLKTKPHAHHGNCSVGQKINKQQFQLITIAASVHLWISGCGCAVSNQRPHCSSCHRILKINEHRIVAQMISLTV